MKKSSPANSLAKYIILIGNNRGHYLWRNNTVGVFDPKTKRYRANVTHRSVGDVIGVTKEGKHIEFEIKIGRDKQSDFQIGHQEMIEKRNGLYFIIKEQDDFDVLVKDKLI